MEHDKIKCACKVFNLDDHNIGVENMPKIRWIFFLFSTTRELNESDLDDAIANCFDRTGLVFETDATVYVESLEEMIHSIESSIEVQSDASAADIYFEPSQKWIGSRGEMNEGDPGQE